MAPAASRASILAWAVPLASLVEDPDNTRQHPDINLEAIKQSLTRFGQDQLLVVSRGSNVVRKGNGRLQAMRDGAVKFMVKPFDCAALLECVRVALEG